MGLTWGLWGHVRSTASHRGDWTGFMRAGGDAFPAGLCPAPCPLDTLPGHCPPGHCPSGHGPGPQRRGEEAVGQAPSEPREPCAARIGRADGASFSAAPCRLFPRPVSSADRQARDVRWGTPPARHTGGPQPAARRPGLAALLCAGPAQFARGHALPPQASPEGQGVAPGSSHEQRAAPLRRALWEQGRDVMGRGRSLCAAAARGKAGRPLTDRSAAEANARAPRADPALRAPPCPPRPAPPMASPPSSHAPPLPSPAPPSCPSPPQRPPRPLRPRPSYPVPPSAGPAPPSPRPRPAPGPGGPRLCSRRRWRCGSSGGRESNGCARAAVIAGGERRAWGRGDRERARLDPGPARPDRPSPRCAPGPALGAADAAARGDPGRPAPESGCPGPGRDGGQGGCSGHRGAAGHGQRGLALRRRKCGAGPGIPDPRTADPEPRDQDLGPEARSPRTQTPSPEPQDLGTRAGSLAPRHRLERGTREPSPVPGILVSRSSLQTPWVEPGDQPLNPGP